MPLIGHLSNPEFLTVTDQLLNASAAIVPVRVKPQLCRCGCGQAVAVGRKFVNQSHYDQSKGLSAADRERLLARFLQGVPKPQLSEAFGVAYTTVYRLIRKCGLG